MKSPKITPKVIAFFKERSSSFFRENAKIIAQAIFTMLFIGLGIWFILHEKTELHEVKKAISTAQWQWILIGLGLTISIFFLHGFMYQASFRSVKAKVALFDAIVLFLKRNFIAVFLPAGGVSSLAFFTKPIQEKGQTESQILFASSIYGFIGIISVVIVAIPAFVFALVDGSIGQGEWSALAAVILLNVGLFLMYRSVMKQGKMYEWIIKIAPSSEIFMKDLQQNKIDKKQFLLAIIISIAIEFVGIAHVYVAMLALNLAPSLFGAVMAYIISVLFLIVSPFLRGLGLIEVSMSYALIRYGFGNIEAISITFLYRFFEFWTPLFAGAISFLLKINKLLMRIMPAIMLLCLGIVNIVSMLLPAITERLNLISDFLPMSAIHASNYLVLMSGLFLLVTSAFMLKGLRSAWWFAMILSIISLVGHLTKGIDYEEATIAFVVLLVLLATRKEYYIKNNHKLGVIGIQTSLLSILAVLIYGIVGFYFIDKNHFDVDFTFLQSVRYTLQNFFLIGSANLFPNDAFANNFLASIRISGFVSIGFLIYTLVRPFIPQNKTSEDEKSTANNLIQQFGRSSLDYFKTYSDKIIYLSKNKKAFISYRISGNYAVVLENPVAENEEEFKNCIIEFDMYCYENGLKNIYYRIPENYLKLYQSMGKKNLFIGQEGIVNLTTFSLEGGAKKSMRNALKKVSEKELKASIHLPPLKDGLLQKLKSVSDEWLTDTERREIVFSQGMFVWEELKQQTIITVENKEEKIIAFLNIIPDYSKGEGTYDLIRKTKDAPNGIMDFILVELFNHFKTQNLSSVNLGLAPMSGLEEPKNFPERSMKYAYKKIKSFAHYKGLRDFKEKFSPDWHNEYLVYSNDYDLLQIPTVLSNVIKP